MNRICKTLCFLTLIVGPLFAAPTLVTVSQTIFRADGTAARGSVYITWPTFTTGAGEQVAAGSKQVTLTSTGLLTVQLAPNIGATPSGTRYLVVYRLDLGTPRNVGWVVPASGPVTVTDIESTTLTTPSSVVSLVQLNAAGATNGQCIVYDSALLRWKADSCSGLAPDTAFSAITTATNSTATMTVGTGASLVRTGSGIIDANKILGTTLTSLSGVIKMTSGVPSAAAASDVYALWTGTCSSSTFLRGDGACANPAGGVTSVFTRTGAVVATTGDYTAAQVTNAVDSTSTYSDPSWLTSLLSTKLTFTALGDIVYGGVAGAGTRLAGNTTSTRKFLRQTGTGSVSAAPAWDTIQAGDVPTLNQSTSGNAATATALAANGTNCSSGQPALGVDASGNAEGCAALTAAQVTNAADKTGTNTTGASFTLDMSAVTSSNAIRFPNIAGSAPTTAGAIAYDTTNKNLHVGANSVDTIFGLFLGSAIPTNGNCLQASVSAGVVRIADAGGVCTTGGGGGTVNSGTANHLAYYATTTNAVSDSGLVYTSVPTSVTNDTNVTGSITSNVFTLGWTGTLAKARIISTAMFNDQTNTGSSAFTLDMSASTSAAALRLPNIAGASSTTAGVVSYDTTNKNAHVGANSVDNIVPLLPSASIPTTGDCTKWVVTASVVTLGDAGNGCVTANQNIRGIVGAFDGAGSALTTSYVTYIPVPFACTLTNFTIAVDTGTIDFDIWKIATGGTAIPTVSNTIISGSSYLAISTGTKVGPSSISSSLTSTAVTANDTVGIKVHAISSATKATIVLQCNAT